MNKEKTITMNYEHKQTLPFDKQQLFQLVLDVEQYPHFLPWCTSVDIVSADTQNNILIVDMKIGKAGFSHNYISKISYTACDKIIVEQLSGPFKFLHSTWEFIQESPQSCCVLFTINFELGAGILQAMLNQIFHKACTKMVDAFSQRAHFMYPSK